MKDIKIRRLVQGALFAALSCIMTMVIQIPAPTGYVNLGDCVVLLGAWMLGPLWGGVAGAIGSMLADVLNGWASYAPGTFMIKFAVALVAGLVYQVLTAREHRYWGFVLGAMGAEVLMALGYFAYESTILSYGMAAAASIPANLVQGAVSTAAAVAAAMLLDRAGVPERLEMKR